MSYLQWNFAAGVVTSPPLKSTPVKNNEIYNIVIVSSDGYGILLLKVLFFP